MKQDKDDLKALFGVITVIALVMLFIAGIMFGLPAYHRYQKRANARNNVKVTHINIQRAQQQARIVRAEIAATKAAAEKRYQESIGIRRAQDEIAKTLTRLYIQHEAIQSQERIAESGKNNTLIYIPSGDQGVPLVQDPGNVNRLSPTPPQ